MPRSFGGQKHSPETLRTTRRSLVEIDIEDREYCTTVSPLYRQYNQKAIPPPFRFQTFFDGTIPLFSRPIRV